MRLRHARWGWLAMLAMLAMAALPERAAAQSDTALSEQLYQLRIAQGPEALLPALGRDTVVLLPTLATLRMAQVRVTAADSTGIAARVEPEGLVVGVDLDAGVLMRGDSSRFLAPDAAAWRDGEMYLAPEALAWMLGVTIDLDPVEVLAVVSGTERLPVVRRRARELQRQALRDPFGTSADIVEVRSARPLADGAVLDWSYFGSTRDPLGTSTVQLALGTQTLGGGLETSIRHNNSPFDDATDVRTTWTGAWPNQPWLRQARVGDFFSGARRSQVLQGFEISNAPYLRSAAFGAELLSGRLEPGWELDLLRDGVVAGYSQADSSGAYRLEVPVHYGFNPVEIEATGPAGERVRRTLLLVVPFDRIPAGEVEYTLSGGRCRQGNCGAALQSSVRYGLSSAMTVEAGSDVFWRDSLPDLFAPYALVAASPAPAVHSTVELVANGFWRGRFEYSPSPDFQIDASHAVYDTTITMSPLGGGGTRSFSELGVFWRPTERRGLIVHGSLVRARGRIGLRDAVGASVVVPVRGARVAGGLAWERSGAEEATQGALQAHGTIDAVLSGPTSWLRATLVRAGVAVESGEGVELIAASLGRRIHRLVRLDAGATWRRGVGTTLDIGFSTELTGARLASHSRYTDREGVGGTQSAEGSLLWNARERRVEFANGRSLGRSGVVGVVFLDDNGNGVRDTGEPTIPDIRLRVGSRGARADSAGRFEAWDLIPFEPMTIEIDGASIENPLLVPAIDGLRVTPRPNTVELVELPLAPAGELAGIVTVAGNGRSVGGIGVSLRHVASGTAARATTFKDGTFFASGLRPGTYVIELSQEALDYLGLRQPSTRTTVRRFDPARDATISIVLERAE